LANIKSAIKRARQNITRRLHNARQRSTLRTHIKNVVKAIAIGDKQQANVAFAKAQPVLDKATSKKLIHQRKAARYKHRLSAQIKAL